MIEKREREDGEIRRMLLYCYNVLNVPHTIVHVQPHLRRVLHCSGCVYVVPQGSGHRPIAASLSTGAGVRQSRRYPPPISNATMDGPKGEFWFSGSPLHSGVSMTLCVKQCSCVLC